MKKCLSLSSLVVFYTVWEALHPFSGEWTVELVIGEGRACILASGIIFAADRAVMTARLCGVLNGRKDQRSISTYAAAALCERFKTGNGPVLALTCFRGTASGLRRPFWREGGNLGAICRTLGLVRATLVGMAFILKGAWVRKFWPSKPLFRSAFPRGPCRTQLQEFST